MTDFHHPIAAVLLAMGLCAAAGATDPSGPVPQRVAWSHVSDGDQTAAPPPSEVPVVQRQVEPPAGVQRPRMQAVDLYRNEPRRAPIRETAPQPRPAIVQAAIVQASRAPTSLAPRAATAASLATEPIALATAQEDLPPHAIPLPVELPPDNIRVSGRNSRISIQAVEASLSGLLAMIAEQQGLNIVSADISDQRVTVTLHDVDLDDAFNTILAVNGYTWSRQKNIVIVSSLSAGTNTAAMLGTEVRVYNLNYVLANDIEAVVNGLLSPVGKAYTKQTSPTDQRQTHEQLVVEDLPTHLLRIESYLSQADIPPRQVLVEAHVLQVSLRDEMRHGVNFNNMLRVAGSNVSLESPGFANDAGPTTVLRFHGADLSGLLEAIKTTTDSKTLASPKVAVLNGQEARMQVGGQIGYLMTTTTQTSTLQSVNFLDVGVILSVTPIITDDHQVLLQVRPQVSTGNINATTQLPESETTEVDTKVMLADGEGLIIGGLIQEIDNDAQNKVPLLGNIKYVGRLFQKRKKELERNEIIIVLVPRILTNDPFCRELCPDKLDQATTPLLHGALKQNDRRMWEAELPDASRNDLRLRRKAKKSESIPYELSF